MKAVFEYSDFRRYLCDYYLQRKKSSSSGYSYERFAQDAGFQSPNFFQLVIDGKRNLTLETLHQTADALGFEGMERDYFEALVGENQTPNPKLRARLSEKRLALRRSFPSIVEEPLAPGITLWFQPAVALLSDGLEREGAVSLSSKRLRITTTEAREAINALLHSGLLIEKVDEGGRVILRLAAQSQIFSDPRSLAEVQRIYLQGQLVRSGEAFERDYGVTPSKFLSETLLVPPGSEKRLLESLNERIQTLIAEIDREESDREVAKSLVPVQINLQIFEARRRPV